MSATLCRRLSQIERRTPRGLHAMSDEALHARMEETAARILVDPATSPEMAELIREAMAESDAPPPPFPWPPATPALDAFRAALRSPA
jgi:hypothetical protein